MSTKTERHTITDIIQNKIDTPLKIDVIPNNMGINLCSVEAMRWETQDDGQLVSLTIEFIPCQHEKRPTNDRCPDCGAQARK